MAFDGPCEEKGSLLEAYLKSTAEYSRSVRDLQKYIGTTGRSVYEDLRRIAEDSRIQSERARLELERHVSSHGC
jgi:hypothetical protein